MLKIFKIIIFLFTNNYIFCTNKVNVDIYGLCCDILEFTFNNVEMNAKVGIAPNLNNKYQNNLEYFYKKFNEDKEENKKIDENNYIFVNKSEFFNDTNNLKPDKNNETFKFRKIQDITFKYDDGLKEEYKRKIPNNLNFILKKEEFLKHLESKELDLNAIYIIKNSKGEHKKIEDIKKMSYDQFNNFILNSSSFELKFKHECYDKCSYKVVFCHNPDLAFDFVNQKELNFDISKNNVLVSHEFKCDPNGYKNISCTCKGTYECICTSNIFFYTFYKLFEQHEIKRDGDNFKMTEELNMNNFLTYASFFSHLISSISFLLKDRYSGNIIDLKKLNNNDYDYKIENEKNDKETLYGKGKTIINAKNFDNFYKKIFDTNITIYVILNGNIEKKKYKTNIGTSDNKSLKQEVEYFDMSKTNGSIMELASYLATSKLIPEHSCEYYVDENGKIKQVVDELRNLIFNGNKTILKPYNNDVCGIFLKGCTSKELMDHINANSKYLNGLSIDKSNFEALSCCINCMKCCACCCCCSKTCCNPLKNSKKR